MTRRDVAQGLPRHLEEKFSKHPYLLNVSFESITRCFFRCQISIPKNVSENNKILTATAKYGQIWVYTAIARIRA